MEGSMSRRLLVPAALILLGLMLMPHPSAQQVMPRDAPKAFVNARLIDGTTVIDDAVMLVSEGRVQAAGPARRVKIPLAAQRVDVDGRFVVPGFINAHGHVGDAQGLKPGTEENTEANVRRQLGVYARYGITTVVSLGDDGGNAPFVVRDEQKTVDLDHARLFVAGSVLNPKTVDEARQQVGEHAARRVDIIKIRVDDNLGRTEKMPEPVFKALIEEAHARKLRVAAHLYYLADAKALVRAGLDVLAHSVRDLEVDDEFLSLAKARGVCMSPTLVREVSTFVYETTPAFFADPFFLREVGKEVVDDLSKPERQASVRASASAQQYKASLKTAMRNLKRMSDAGITVALGTDSGASARFQGYFEHMEMDLMAEAGLTAPEILKAATLGAASCMRVSNDLGSLAAGRWADFVVLETNPLENISNARQINSVWIAGNRIVRPTNGTPSGN
jgi:imidazolonepropionase-like amidohydrolase